MIATLATDYLTGAPFKVDTEKHISIIGGSGMGKTTLLANLIIQAIEAGLGILLIDPHGDLADLIVRHIPKERFWDLIWFDPAAPRVPTFNPLYFKTPEERELQKEAVFTTIKSVSEGSSGASSFLAESTRVTYNALDAICEYYKRPNMSQLFRFIGDDTYRTKILSKTHNPLLRMFREQYDEKLRPSDQMAKFSPPLNKIDKFMRPFLLPIVGVGKSLDFLDIMNHRRILICRLSKGRIGEENAQILGSLIVSMVSIAALRRENQEKRPDFLLVVDETHNFTHSGRFSTILTEGRKYGVSLVSATQGLYQLSFARDLLANCPTQIAFNSLGEDADMLASNWKSEAKANEIAGLSRYSFIARSFQNNVPKIQTLLADPINLIQTAKANPTKLIKHSLERWGTSRKETEKKIYKFLSS